MTKMSEKSMVADFSEIKANIKEMKQGDFDNLRYFFEIRKLYSMLQALFAGGAIIVNSKVMGKVPIETLEKRFNMLIQMVEQVCEFTLEIRDIAQSQGKAPSEEKPEEKPPKLLNRRREINYLV